MPTDFNRPTLVNPPKVASDGSPAKAVLTFVMHQFIGTWGIAFFAALALTTTFDGLAAFGWHSPMRYVHWVLTQNPYYPVQISLGLYFGWRLSRRFRHKSMVLVWIAPLVILCGAVVTFTPAWRSVLVHPPPGQTRLSHYFGWGCQPTNHCLDQLLATMPFYVSVAYSLGAWLGRRKRRVVHA
jgi:hypothetical protein